MVWFAVNSSLPSETPSQVQSELNSDCLRIPFNLSEVNQYSLSQNYPNPFNPKTIISFTIPKNQFVELKIYDLLGNEIAVLVNEYKLAGKTTLEFDASNLSSGVYFYRIKVDDFIQTKKILLAK